MGQSEDPVHGAPLTPEAPLGQAAQVMFLEIGVSKAAVQKQREPLAHPSANSDATEINPGRRAAR